MNIEMTLNPRLALILLTVSAKGTCWIEYQGMNGKVTERTITPTRILFDKDGWIVEADCHLRESFRTFRLDGILNVSGKAPEKTYSSGQRIRHGGDEYILAQVGPQKVCAISLYNGNRFHEPTNVGDTCRITTDEMKKITGDGFTLIS